MKIDIEKIIEIPEGVEVKLDGTNIRVKGKEGENHRKFNSDGIELEMKENKLRLFSKKATKREKKVINTFAAHIKNMIEGVQKKFEYKLKIAASHFPMTVEIKGKEATIKNFLGEKIPRKVKIPEGVEIESTKEDLTIKSVNRELAGQAAANFEKATWVRSKDRRIFQDGIFMTHKPGREI